VEGANEVTVAWTLAVALSATLVILTLIGIVGLWWTAVTTECRQAAVEAGVEPHGAPSRESEIVATSVTRL